MNFFAGLTNMPGSSKPPENIQEENVVTQDEESNWLHRNDAYEMQQIGGRMRPNAMPIRDKIETTPTIDIAHGNVIILALQSILNYNQRCNIMSAI